MPTPKKKQGKKRTPLLDLEALSYRDLLRYSPDGLLVFDTHNVIQAFNKGAEEIFGYTAREVIDKPFYFLIPPEVLQAGEVERLQAVVDKEGCLHRHYVTRLHKNGTRIKLELTRSPIIDAKGRVLGYEAVFRDITQTLEFESQLRLSEKLAAVGKLVNGLAHEIGTPLNIIYGNAELIMGELEPDDVRVEPLKTILSACGRITALMKALLKFVSQKEPETTPVDINGVVRDLLNFLRIQLKRQNIETRLELANNLPFIMGDKIQIEEIFLNVFMNSTQAMAEGGELHIKTALVNEKGWRYLAIEIKDTGCGIPAEVIPRIFEPFFSTKEVGKGTGLGLYIAHNLVQRHKGRILIESSPGKGTTATILLPVGPLKTKSKEAP